MPFVLIPLLSLGSSFVIAGVSAFLSPKGSVKSTQNNIPPGMVEFTDQSGTKKIWTKAKYDNWVQIQTYAVDIATSERWKPWTTLHSFRKLTNGGKLDAIMGQVNANSDLFRKGWMYSQPGGYSYLDFAIPGIDINNLGAGSENAFSIFISDLGIGCVLSAIGGLAATVGTGGTASPAALALSFKACKK